jgi:hypothetical protein
MEKLDSSLLQESDPYGLLRLLHICRSLAVCIFQGMQICPKKRYSNINSQESKIGNVTIPRKVLWGSMDSQEYFLFMFFLFLIPYIKGENLYFHRR